MLRRREIGFVFQFFNLVQTLTVAENVDLPALLVGTSREGAAAARGALDRLGVSAARTPFPPGCPAGSSSGSRSRARSSTGRGSCSPTSPPATSTRRARGGGGAAARACERGADRPPRDARPARRRNADRVLQLRDGLLVEETRLESGEPAAAIVASLLSLEV